MLTEFTKQWLHDNMYVSFKKSAHCESDKIHKKPFYEQMKELTESGYRQIKHTTIRKEFKTHCFAISECGNYLRLTWKDKSGYHQRYTNFKDDAKNDKRTGSAIGTFKRAFKTRTKQKFSDVFGTVPHFYKRCVPGLFHYDNPLEITGKVHEIMNVNKYDFSSHFPACACGELPNANTAIIKDGIQEPTAEYPFAFYPANGFVAEYGKYNTFDWLSLPFASSVLRFDEDDKWQISLNAKPYTVLMKAADITIDPEMINYYQTKLNAPKGSPERDEAKLVLLKIVGQMEQNSRKCYDRQPYAHLAAIIKARAVYKMLNLINKIGIDNVISVIVDGIICRSINKHVEDTTEHLGSLKLEHKNAIGWFLGHNQYVLKDDKGTEITHAGYDLDITEDITTWRKSPSMNLRKSIAELGINIEILPWKEDEIDE